MNTIYEKLTNCSDDQKLLQKAGKIIRDGGLVAFPTETVYGLGGDGMNPSSAKKIYEAKGRPSDNPLIVHICELKDLEILTDQIPEKACLLAAEFWPGPLTMILKKSKRVPFETTGGLDTVAVRMPSLESARILIREAGGFVAAPSANVSGRPSPTLAEYVYEDLNGRVDMILDGGQVGIGLESTIVDLTGDIPYVLRPGSVTLEMLRKILNDVRLDPGIQENRETKEPPKAPGMKYRHYAPKGELVILEGKQEKVIDFINTKTEEYQAKGEKVGVICTDETADFYHAGIIKSLGGRNDEGEIAKQLYKILREMDLLGATYIFAESFQSEGMGQAIMNRLRKAAGQKVIKID